MGKGREDMVKRRYLPHTDEDRQAMLQTIGEESIEGLFSDIPEEVRTKHEMNIPKALSEVELLDHMRQLAQKNVNATQMPYFIGTGTYDHYIPSIVGQIIMRQEFLTAYVPYQPEVSQGELQALFEWQSLICELTGMDVANSGMYDGYNAVAEACNLAFGAVKKSTRVLISKALNPQASETIRTYGFGKGYKVESIDLKEDITDVDDLKEKMGKDVAAVVVQYPNFFGSIEDIRAIKEVMAESKALLIVSANPLALAKLEQPGKLGADITVGDVQAFGIPMAFGGPHCGYFAANKKYMRKMPSRIVGQTSDAEGKRGFVMALATREQHIRREKATSNYSSNQALFALASAIAMNALGKKGIVEMAQRNINHSHYLAHLLKEKGFKIINSSPFFNEFLVQLPKDPKEINEALLQKGFVGGFDASDVYGKKDVMLLCATEKRSKGEIEAFASALMEVSKS